MMLDLSKIRIHAQKESSDHGIYVVEPLEQGYGHTLGNSLRRVMLTSLTGAAITSVKIEGVTHQYTTVPGMKEDVVEFILQIKQVRLQLEKNDPVRFTLSARGPKKVAGQNLTVPSGVTVVNPDVHLATLAKGGKLEVEMVAQKGSGFSASEERPASEIGVIPIDALFNPVRRVNYTVEATRVGRITNYDKLTLEVFTNGTLAPLVAIQTSIRILIDHFQVLLGEKAFAQEVEPVIPETSQAVLNRPIDEIELPVRVINSLKAHGIETVGDLSQMTKKELASVRNLGAKSIELIEGELATKGVALG